MNKAEDRAVRQLIDTKGLSPKNQKLAYARTTALKQLLVEKGILTEEDENRFQELANAMLGDINRKIEQNMRQKKADKGKQPWKK